MSSLTHLCWYRSQSWTFLSFSIYLGTEIKIFDIYIYDHSISMSCFTNPYSLKLQEHILRAQFTITLMIMYNRNVRQQSHYEILPNTCPTAFISALDNGFNINPGTGLECSRSRREFTFTFKSLRSLFTSTSKRT